MQTVFTTQGRRKDSRNSNQYEIVNRRDVPVCNSDGAHMHKQTLFPRNRLRLEPNGPIHIQLIACMTVHMSVRLAKIL